MPELDAARAATDATVFESAWQSGEALDVTGLINERGCRNKSNSAFQPVSVSAKGKSKKDFTTEDKENTEKRFNAEAQSGKRRRGNFEQKWLQSGERPGMGGKELICTGCSSGARFSSELGTENPELSFTHHSLLIFDF